MPELSIDETSTLALLHNFFIALLTGVGRAARGEILSSSNYTTYFAVDHLLELFRYYIPTDQPTLIDPLDSSRRCEVTHPELAKALQVILRLPVSEQALRLLELADKQLRICMSNYPQATVEIVRQKLAKQLNS